MYKLNLENDTRFGLTKPKQYYKILRCQKVWLTWFMLSKIFQIWIWIFNHKQINILTNFWRWNHTKRMHQLIVKKFSNLMTLHHYFFAPKLHTDCIWFIIFFYFEFWFTFFFYFFLTLQTIQIQNFIIFLQRI